jgi:hypothetical protein
MHELGTDRDHAMCNIQNVPFQWSSLYNFEKLSMKKYQATGVLNSLHKSQVLQYKVSAQAMEVPG